MRAVHGIAIVLRRELQLIARQRAFGVALLIHTGVMTAFVLAWSSGPAPQAFPGRGFYDSVRLVQLAVLGLLLPWTVARVVAMRPPRLMASRAVAAALAMALLAFAAFPVMLLADRMEDAGVAHALRGELDVQALSALAVATVLAWRRLCHDRLIGWMAATISTCGLVAAVLYLQDYAR